VLDVACSERVANLVLPKGRARRQDSSVGHSAGRHSTAGSSSLQLPLDSELTVSSCSV